jgi:hypothetical protein
VKCEEINPQRQWNVEAGNFEVHSATRKMCWKFVRGGPSLTLHRWN